MKKKGMKRYGAAAVCALAGTALLLFGSSFGSCRLWEQTAVPISSDILTEEQVLRLCEQVEGVDSPSFFIGYGQEGDLIGVSVVCGGGDNPTVQKKLIDLIGTAYGIPSHRICITGK